MDEPSQTLQFNPELVLQEGFALLQSGDLAAAYALAQTCLSHRGNHADGWYLLAQIAFKQGDLTYASEHIRKALQIQPTGAIYYQYQGDILLAQNKTAEAIWAYEQALFYEPDAAPVFCKLALILCRQGKLNQAQQYLEQLLAYQPQNAQALLQLGELYLHQNNPECALTYYRQIVIHQSEHAEACRKIAFCLKLCGQTQEALPYLEQALTLDAGHMLLQLERATLLPRIYHNLEEVAYWRAHYRQCLAGLLQLVQDGTKPTIPQDIIIDAPFCAFLLAYQGFDDRDLQVQLAKLWPHIIPNLVQPIQLPEIRKPGRIRIGFISRFFYAHSITTCFANLIMALPNEIYDVFCLSVKPKMDSVANLLKENMAHFMSLSPDLESAAQTISELELDILVYTDIGMSTFTYSLAFTRLATIQCVLAGHPVTTGIPTMDYFISSEWLEPSGSNSCYTEQLVRLKGLPVVFNPPLLPLETYCQTPKELGLPDAEHLYVCPMVLEKVHPHFDAILNGILAHDPTAIILFFRDANSQIAPVLQNRFTKNLADAQRIQFVPWAKKRQFLNILMHADVILDTFPFSGGSTSYLALATGTPIVTLPGEHMRGRSTYALYRQMEILDCIATTPSDYVQIAVRIASDRPYRQQLTNRIMAAHHKIFNNYEGVQDLIQFFQTLKLEK